MNSTYQEVSAKIFFQQVPIVFKNVSVRYETKLQIGYRADVSVTFLQQSA